jgi:uncharacterized protein (DUF1330 family)
VEAVSKKGYWIVFVDIRDPDNYPKYLEANREPLEKYGARFLVRGGRNEQPEIPAGSRHVVVEFESYEQALACYHSPEYQAALKLRKQYADGRCVIIEGV